MKLKLKNFIKSNKIAYRIWFTLQKDRLGEHISLPAPSDDLYLDGFPRSGNTYTKSFVTHFYPDYVFAHHLHTVAAIKMALKHNLKCIILMRNPIDSVASWAIMKDYYGQGSMADANFLEFLMMEWKSYYTFVHANIGKLHVLPFHKIVQAERLADYFAEVCDDDIKIEESDIENFDRKIRENQKNKPDKRTSTPNKQRTEMKKQVKEKLEELEQTAVARQLHDDIMAAIST